MTDALSFTPLPARKGRIAYRKAASGTLWGGEEWRITREDDGTRTLSAHCEMALGDDAVVRDCVLSLDGEYQPREAYVRICNQGRRTGSGIYWLTKDTLEAQCQSDDDGRLSSTVPIARPLRGFGCHALQADGWLAAAFPFEQGEGSDWFPGRNPNHSLHHLGATGPGVELSESGLRYHGREDVTVPAGTFACRKMELVGIVNDHPPYYFWVTTDGDCLFVKGVVEGYMDSVFLLETLEGETLQ